MLYDSDQAWLWLIVCVTCAMPLLELLAGSRANRPLPLRTVVGAANDAAATAAATTTPAYVAPTGLASKLAALPVRVWRYWTPPEGLTRTAKTALVFYLVWENLTWIVPFVHRYNADPYWAPMANQPFQLDAFGEALTEQMFSA